MDTIWMIGQIFTTLFEIFGLVILLGVMIEAVSPGEVKVASKIFDVIARIEVDEEEL